MRSNSLPAALGAHLEAVAAHLQGDIADGAEVPFELERRGGRAGARRPALYCYRPLIGEFLEQRWAWLEALPTHHDAALALADFDGLERYLLDHGRGAEAAGGGARQRVRLGLLTVMEDAFGEHGDLQLDPQRVEAALAALDGAASSCASELTVLAQLRGLAITSPEVPITAGVSIVREDALAGPLPDTGAALCAAAGEPLFVVLESEAEDPRAALLGARGILADLLRALRLFGDGRIALDPLAWARIGAGGWRPFPLGGHRPPGGTLVVRAEQEDELRAFCNLVSRRVPEGNALAWALERYGLGCERASAYEALADNLLALRALLEDEHSPPAQFAQRLAALCATPDEAPELAARVEQGLELERVLRGGAAHPGAAAEDLAEELGGHLRALLRDMICDHLQEDLIELAERIRSEAVDLEAEQPHAEEFEQAEPKDGLPARPPAAAASLEEIFSHASESGEILDVFV
jgi:hypothetical protein